MKINIKHIFVFILALFIGMMTTTDVVWAAAANSCKKGDCSSLKDCYPATSGKSYKQASSSISVGGQCLKDKTAGGCYNPNPTSCSVSYNGLGNRGASRNHYGSDIGSKGCPNIGNITVYAPADGEIVRTEISSGGGRTMIIEHDKKCSGGGKYKTIYRHLAAYLKTSGHVNKGDPVAIEGGSNCYNKKFGEACLCDNRDQSVGKVFTGCNKVNAYKIHLHIETVNSGFNGSNSYVGGEMQNVVKPYCGGVQALCGGCPMDLTSCLNTTELANDGTVANLEGIEGGSAGGSVGGESYSADGCNFESYLDSQNCTFCELFKVLFNAASSIAKLANDRLASPTKGLVCIGFLIWMCVYLLRHVASYSKVSTGEMLKGILFQGFRVAVVIIALSGAIYSLMDLTLNPVMETGLEFGRSLNNQSTCDDNSSYMQGIVGYDETTGFPTSENADNNQIGGLSKHLGESIICSIKNLEDSVGFLMSLGKYSICIAFDKEGMYDTNFFASLGYLSTGCFLWITGALLLLSFPWCLVDCILQLCVAVALIPCAVGAYAFKITSQYLKLIWSMFMNSMFQFVFMAIIIYIINSHLGDWIGYTPGSVPDYKIFITAYSAEGLACWGIGFLKVLMVCMFSWTFFDEAKGMADEFAKGIGMNIGRKVGADVSGFAATRVMEPGAKMAGKAIGATAIGIGRGINRGINNSSTVKDFRNWRNGRKYNKMKNNGATETHNADGSTSVSKTSTFMGIKRTQTITQNADGSYSKSTETRQRSNYEKYFKQTTDENGNTHMQARKSFMGMTMFGLLGKQEMEAKKDDATGRTIWTTKDGEGSRERQLVTDENGNVVSFNKYSNLDDKNIMTQAMHYHSGKDHAPISSVGTRTSRDNVMKIKEQTDAKGNVVGRTMELRNVAPDLVRQSGTTNMEAMNYILQNAENKERAYEAIVVEHMKQRGMSISDEFNSRDVTINSDNSVTILQTNRDGTKQEITAQMDGNQMIIERKSYDKAGDPTRYIKHNGIQSRIDVYQKQKDGSYSVTTRQGFSDYYMQTNRHTPPLNAGGTWGYNIDREKAMRGFTQKDFDEHVAQLQKGFGKNLTMDNMSKDDIMTRMKT